MEQNKLSCGNIFTVNSAATKTPTFRKLEDLNLIDNFLFQEMLTQKEDGEKFARILLKTILDMPIRNVKIFLYTKGTEGNPRQELKDMLKYIEKSTVENITNQDIASVSELVNKVKKRKEVGINYMKSWEMEQMAREEGYAKGLDELNQLYSMLLGAGRNEDVLRAIQDKDYLKQLLTEMGFDH